MTRRVVLSFVGLALVLLAGVVLPLGLVTARQDRREFHDATMATAQSLASAAEEVLGERSATATTDFARAVPPGQQAAVLDRAGTVVTGAQVLVPVDLMSAALSGASGYQWTSSGLLVVTGVGESLPRLGAVAVLRPTASLQARIGGRWVLLGGVSVTAILVSVGLAVWLGRWAGRPVEALQRTATRFGEGDLAARAQVFAGPPEVRALAEEFNRTAARLDRLVRGHRVLVADVAHDVRTPMMALRLRLELLAQESTGEAAEELAGALGEVGRLSRLVDGLLTAARAEAGAGSRVLVDVVPALHGRAEVWRPLAEERGAAVLVEAIDPLQVRAGEGHIEQVLDNLIANALDVGAQRVRLRAYRHGDLVGVAVTDDGPGMSEQTRQTVLRRFEGHRPGGTGLGLSIVDRLVTADGGTVRLVDSPGGGLTVEVCLPAA